jgi:hypothetical protein
MSEIKDGGPAFPQYVINNGGAYVDGGMTLRDYFAAQALNGICANQDNRVYGNSMEFARAAYRLADAMLTARGRG